MVDGRVQEAAICVLVGQSGKTSRQRPLSPSGPASLMAHHGVGLAGGDVVSSEAVRPVGAQQVGRGQAEGPAQ